LLEPRSPDDPRFSSEANYNFKRMCIMTAVG